jgi:copper chaperone CopZ
MTKTLTFPTDLHCDACVAAVKPYLDAEPSISEWNVDAMSPDHTPTVRGDSVSAEGVAGAVAKAGFRVLESRHHDDHDHASHDAATSGTSTPATYFPLLLIVGFLLGVVALVEFAADDRSWHRAMRHFMGGFFLAFSFFKLLDLRGFADAFRMYDVVARRFPAYAYAYPFIELALGAAYVTRFQPVATNLVTLVVMAVSTVGVLQSLLAKRKIRCACLGTVFNLPMTTVTLVEDTLMAVMAAAMLLGGAFGIAH